MGKLPLLRRSRREREQVGNLLLSEVLMAKKEIDKSADKHIRITDIMLKEQIDKVMEHKDYKSFSKVINDALSEGLPILIERLYGNVKIENSETQIQSTPEQIRDMDLLNEIVKQLRLIKMYTTMNQRMMSSIFNAMDDELKGKTVSGENFHNGYLRDTPHFLERYEITTLKEICPHED